MKKLLIMMMMSALFVSAANETKPETKAEAKPEKDISMKDVSYCFGLNMGRYFKDMKVDADLDMIMAGIGDGLKGAKPKLKKNEQRSIMLLFQKEVNKRKMKLLEERKIMREKLAPINKEKGAKFLAENLKKKGVKATESGLQYIVVKEGSGDSPKPTDTIKVNYRGTLLDGTVFDSSYLNDEPATFQVQAVIPGWIEGIQLMKVGGKYTFYIAPELAYQYRGAGPDIGPNETLIFDVELLEIVK